MASSSESELLKPICVQCSKAWSAKHTDGLPATVLVDRATVMQPTPGRYIAVAHCHGESCIVSLGDAMPSDAKVRSARAFA